MGHHYSCLQQGHRLANHLKVITIFFYSRFFVVILGDDYTKKQLQDRTRNIHYKRKKRRKMLKGVQQPQIEEADNYFDDDNNAPDVFMNNDEDAEEIEDKKSDVVQATSVSQSEYESQRIKAEKAREAAEIMYAKAEEARMKRIELETRVQEARLKRENLLAEIASIDAQHRRLN